jgi:hypothetical protein
MKRFTLALLLVVSGRLLFAWPQAHPPQDVKGWRTTTWGMTPAQVSAAAGLNLGNPVSPDVAKEHYRGTLAMRAAADFTVIKEYDVSKVPIADWTGEGQFVFGDSGRTGLTAVVLLLQVSFADIRNEVKAQYGDPTSDNSIAIEGKMAVFSNTWIFSSTEIDLTSTEASGSTLMYRRHSALSPVSTRDR